MKSEETIEKIKKARNENIDKASQTVRKKAGRGDSGYKGVYSHRDKWQAKIKLKNGKQKSLGCYESAEEAAKSYDVYAIKEYGKDNCFLNFPEENYGLKETAIVSVDYYPK